MKNRAFFLILLVLAVPLYLWDTHTLLSGLFAHKKASAVQSQGITAAPYPMLLNSPKFVEKGRSPFLPFKEIPQPIAKQKPVAKTKTSASIIPPKVAITGILWNPTNPIAMMTFPDGSSGAVKAGQTVGNIYIRTIEKNKVLIVYENKDFWISQ